MSQFWQQNDNENRRFWDWFFRIEDLSEQPLRENEAIEITERNANGETRTFAGVHLKKTLSTQKKKH